MSSEKPKRAKVEFVLVSPAQEIAALESLFPDLMRLSSLRDLAWRSEVETARQRFLRHRAGSHPLNTHT